MMGFHCIRLHKEHQKLPLLQAAIFVVLYKSKVFWLLSPQINQSSIMFASEWVYKMYWTSVLCTACTSYINGQDHPWSNHCVTFVIFMKNTSASSTMHTWIAILLTRISCKKSVISGGSSKCWKSFFDWSISET